MVSEINLVLKEEADSLRLGAQLASIIHPGLTVHLKGELGSGKTFLVRALLRALGYQGVVKSPSYTLLESYVVSKLHLYHFDFYRFKDPYEWEDLGFRQYFNKTAIVFVEWPEKASGIPEADIEITIRMENAVRIAHLCALTPAGERCLIELQIA